MEEWLDKLNDDKAYMNHVQMVQKRIIKSQGNTMINSELTKEIWTLKLLIKLTKRIA